MGGGGGCPTPRQAPAAQSGELFGLRPNNSTRRSGRRGCARPAPPASFFALSTPTHATGTPGGIWAIDKARRGGLRLVNKMSPKWSKRRYTVGRMKKPRSYSPMTTDAARLLGASVRAARLERRWTVEELAERVGVNHTTLRKVERGDLTVGLGVAFEAAALVGLPLFGGDDERRSIEIATPERSPCRAARACPQAGEGRR